MNEKPILFSGEMVRAILAGHAGEWQRAAKKNRKDWDRRCDELGALDVASRAESYTEGRRIFYGVANGMDRIAAIGNGQVPIVAAFAWQTLSARMTANEKLSDRP